MMLCTLAVVYDHVPSSRFQSVKFQRQRCTRGTPFGVFMFVEAGSLNGTARSADYTLYYRVYSVLCWNRYCQEFRAR
eukprot:6077764-Amphidinium_carterae.1